MTYIRSHPVESALSILGGIVVSGAVAAGAAFGYDQLVARPRLEQRLSQTQAGATAGAVDAANNKADAAVKDAQNAVDIANAARTTANGAQSTANNAGNAANSAVIAANSANGRIDGLASTLTSTISTVGRISSTVAPLNGFSTTVAGVVYNVGPYTQTVISKIISDTSQQRSIDALVAAGPITRSIVVSPTTGISPTIPAPAGTLTSTNPLTVTNPVTPSGAVTTTAPATYTTPVTPTQPYTGAQSTVVATAQALPSATPTAAAASPAPVPAVAPGAQAPLPVASQSPFVPPMPSATPTAAPSAVPTSSYSATPTVTPVRATPTAVAPTAGPQYISFPDDLQTRIYAHGGVAPVGYLPKPNTNNNMASRNLLLDGALRYEIAQSSGRFLRERGYDPSQVAQFSALAVQALENVVDNASRQPDRNYEVTGNPSDQTGTLLRAVSVTDENKGAFYFNVTAGETLYVVSFNARSNERRPLPGRPENDRAAWYFPVKLETAQKIADRVGIELPNPAPLNY